MKTAAFLLICGLGIAGCSQSDTTPPQSSAAAPDQSNVQPTNVAAAPTPNADNTAINSRDRDSGAITAGAQGQSQSDVNMTAGIRRRIMNGNLSITAQNVKVICQDGKVTLRGPVNSQYEKDTIGRMAADAAGVENVDNQLEIKPNS